jgi:hypothetical protein
MTVTYDRQEGETAKAYAAYCIYRNMGADRSLEKTAIKFYPRQSPDTYRTHPNIARIERWSKTWNWVERCKDFDRDEEAILRDRIRQQNIEEHNRKLEQFRLQNETIGFGLLETGREFLAIANLIIATFKDKEVLDKRDIELFLAIPSSIKAIAGFCLQGSNLAADGLLIRQLMEKIKEAEG